MMKPKWYTMVAGIIGVGIIFVVVLGVVWRVRSEEPAEKMTSLRDIATAKKDFKLSYESYDANSVWDVSSFEDKDDLIWGGGGFFDDRIVHSGKTSLGLISHNNERTSAYTENLVSLGDFEELSVVTYATETNNLESLMIFMGSKEKPHAYSFPVTNLVDQNVMVAPRDQFLSEDRERSLPWREVDRIEFSIVSRPGKTVILNLDDLQIERNTKYREDWNMNALSFLSLGKNQDRLGLLVRGVGTSVATMRAIPTARDFVYRVQLIQESDKKTGVFFRGDARSGYGYVFWLGGVEKNTWGLFARTADMVELFDTGELTNVQFYKNQPVWIEARTKGEDIDVALSLDGENFSPVVNVQDTTFLSGGVGIYAEGGGQTFFNDFSFAQ